MSRPLESWSHLAACRGRDPRMWDKERQSKAEQRQLCSGCPVARQCASDALERPYLAVGVIRAGISFSITNYQTKREALAHWEQVAEHGLD